MSFKYTYYSKAIGLELFTKIINSPPYPIGIVTPPTLIIDASKQLKS